MSEEVCKVEDKEPIFWIDDYDNEIRDGNVEGVSELLDFDEDENVKDWSDDGTEDIILEDNEVDKDESEECNTEDL
mgnify:CR=1 FL=1